MILKFFRIKIYSTALPLSHTVHALYGVLKVRILKWFANPFSSVIQVI